MTNLLCSIIITLVTNVMHTDNAKWGPQCGVFYPEGGQPQEIKQPATEQYDTTTVEKVVTIYWTYEDVPGQTEISRKLLSSVTRIMCKKEQWEAAGMRTNDVTARQNFNSWFKGSVFLPDNLISNIVIQP